MDRSDEENTSTTTAYKTYNTYMVAYMMQDEASPLSPFFPDNPKTIYCCAEGSFRLKISSSISFSHVKLDRLTAS
jgi:hypothetical protein